MKSLSWAVVGAGAGALATAAQLSRRGFSVLLVNRSAARIQPLMDRPTVRVEGVWQGEAPLQAASTEWAMVSRADVVVVTTPATAHRELAAALGPHLRPHQLVVLHPGRTLGALEFAAALSRAGARVRAVAETDTLLFTSRSPRPGWVRITGIKQRLRVAAVPAWRAAEAAGALRALGADCVPVRSVLVTGLHNIGAMFHPAPMVLNAGRIQAGHRFEYYREGITPAVASLVRGLDRERLAVGRAWGIRVEPVESWMRRSYGLPRTLRTLEELVAANPAYAGVMAPETLHHRYLLEDVPTGLVPLAELGRVRGVPAPLMRAVIDMAGELTGADFWRAGRTLASMGLEGLPAGVLAAVAEEGLEARERAAARAMGAAQAAGETEMEEVPV